MKWDKDNYDCYAVDKITGKVVYVDGSARDGEGVHPCYLIDYSTGTPCVSKPLDVSPKNLIPIEVFTVNN